MTRMDPTAIQAVCRTPNKATTQETAPAMMDQAISGVAKMTGIESAMKLVEQTIEKAMEQATRLAMKQATRLAMKQAMQPAMEQVMQPTMKNCFAVFCALPDPEVFVLHRTCAKTNQTKLKKGTRNNLKAIKRTLR